MANIASAYNTSLADSSRNLNPIIFINQDKHEHLRRNKDEHDEEIGVFRAEKYFNGMIDVESSSISSIGSRNINHHYNRDIVGINLNHVRAKIQPRTPSVRSESSWNSQSALLQNGLKNHSKTKSSKSSTNRGINFFSSLGCKCSCSDKNAVNVKEDVSEISFSRSTNSSYGIIHNRAKTISPMKAGLEFVDTAQINKPPVDSRVKKEINNKRLEILGTGLSRENCFNFSNSESEVGNFPIKSPEVFGSPIMEKRNRSLSLDKRITKMSWDANIPRVDEIELVSAKSGGSLIDPNDSGSEASSDLFELESLTNKTHPFFERKALDDTSGCATPTTCYAPSEASIEWSVVTASAADFSTMSDSEDQRSTVYKSSPKKTTSNKEEAKNMMINREMQRRRSGTFLGCKSHDAVKVAGNVHRTNERPAYDQLMRRRSDSFMALTRSQAETKLADINSRVVAQQAVTTHTFPRLQSPLNSQLLYIQQS